MVHRRSFLWGIQKIIRDWGWAPEYVEAMWLMLQHDKADDFVIATGKSISLEEFVAKVFDTLNLNWENHVEVSRDFFRPSDINESRANPKKAEKILEWKAKYSIDDIVKFLVEEKL